ncbi:MAG: xanthine dehydrogenase family protein subunit M [Chloroflexi bacterium]|nr:MAG: xanthine dehydrogenase family protein subunit M [Chloroflexota bacterium]
MYPAAFDYRSIASLDEALALLAEHGDAAKVMAGGQSLIPLLKLRFAQPSLVVDIGRMKGMTGVGPHDGWLTIGALTRHVDLERARDLPRQLSLLSEAAHWIQGPFTTALRPDEILTEIRVAASSKPAAGAYNKLERKVGDFATVAVAVQIELEGGKVSKAGIGLTAVGPTNVKATAAEKALVGHEPTDAVIAEAARLAAAAAEPKDDIRGSAEFKKDVVRVYVQRGLKTALARAKEARA